MDESLKTIVDAGIGCVSIGALTYVLLIMIKHNELWLSTITELKESISALKSSIDESVKKDPCKYRYRVSK
jgi:hypothetical protein